MSCSRFRRFHNFNLQLPAKKVDPLFFLNNSLNIQFRTPKPLTMCFYWPMWHFIFFYLFALLSTLTYLERHGSKGNDFPWIGYTYFWRKCYHISIATTLNWKWGFEAPIENLFFTQHLSTNGIKDKNSFGKAQTGSFTVWFEASSFWNIYVQNKLGKTRVLIFHKWL